MCLSLRIAFLIKIQARSVKATGLGVAAARGSGYILRLICLSAESTLCTELCRNRVKPPVLTCLYLLIFIFCHQQMKELSYYYNFWTAFLNSHMRSLTEWKLPSTLRARILYATSFSLSACLGSKQCLQPWCNFLPVGELGPSCALFAQCVNTVAKSSSENSRLRKPP